MIQEMQEKSRLSCDGSIEQTEGGEISPIKRLPETISLDYTLGTQSV